MRVNVNTIGPDGFDFDEPIEQTWLEAALGSDSPFRPTRAGHLKVHLARRRSDVVRARGSLTVEVEADCSRCLFPVPTTLELELDVILFPQGREPKAGADGELGEEDIGVATYRDDVIDLHDMVRDEIFLEMPMTPTCKHADPRDCVHFVNNLGARTSDVQFGDEHEEAKIDPRWASLGKLKSD